jgi:hypothetical protein
MCCRSLSLQRYSLRTGPRVKRAPGVDCTNWMAVKSVFVCGNQVVSSHRNCRQFLWPLSKSGITTLMNSLFSRTIWALWGHCRFEKSLPGHIQASWWLKRQRYRNHIMWIPSHVGGMGNKRADRLAGEAVWGDTEIAAPVRPSDFRLVSRVRMCIWSESGMGRYTYSILPWVSLVLWSRCFDSSRCVVTGWCLIILAWGARVVGLYFLMGCRDWRGLRKCRSFLKRCSQNIEYWHRLGVSNRTLNNFARGP